MAFTANATNTTINPLTLYYRPPEQTMLLQVQIQARALNQLIVFANEDYYKAFLQQNELLIDGKKLIISAKDKTKEKEAIKINEANAKAENAEIRKKKNKAVENSEKSASGKNISLKTEIVKDEA